MTKIQGGCLCGKVRYHSDAEPAVTAICQCTHCQRQSGSAFSVNVGVPKGTLIFDAGQPAVYEDQGTSGQPVHRMFCRDCGSPIVSMLDSTPGLDWLKSGTLDDTSWLKPQVGIWCESAQPWVSMPEGVAQFAQNPPPG